MNGTRLALASIAALAAAGLVRQRGSRGVADDLRVELAALGRKRVRNDDPDWHEYIDSKIAGVEAKLAAVARLGAMRQSGAGDLEQAMDHARSLVAAVGAQPGAPRLRAWGKPGVGARVYFPGDLGFASVGRDGSVQTVSRGREILATAGLYPGWRKAWLAGLSVYRQGLERHGSAAPRRPARHTPRSR